MAAKTAQLPEKPTPYRRWAWIARLWIDGRCCDIHEPYRGVRQETIEHALDYEYLQGRQTHIEWFIRP